MQIGRRIYYDNTTGNVIYDSGEVSGDVRRVSVEDEVKYIKALRDRVRESFDYIELEYGEFSQDFAECTSYKVDVESKEVLFNYEKVEREPVYKAPLSVEVRNLSRTVSEMDEILLELIFDNTINKI